MSEFMLMEPANQTFSELLSNGVKYTVPRFQRDYSWEQEQWEDLWADIEGLDQEGFHYMGNMVLLEQDDLGQADFDTKKAHYLKTPFRLAKKVAEYDHWDLANLNRYQSWLADQAIRTWRVD